MFNLYLLLSVSFRPQSRLHPPVVLNSLDDEAQSRTDAVYVLLHNLLYNRRLSRVVQATLPSARLCRRPLLDTYSINILISLSFSRALRSIDSIFAECALCRASRWACRIRGFTYGQVGPGGRVGLPGSARPSTEPHSLLGTALPNYKTMDL